MQITKYVLPVVVGSMGGIILMTLGETAMHRMYPLPSGTNLYYADSYANAVKQLPPSAFIFKLVNYAVCSFLAGIAATLISLRTTVIPPLVVGIVLTLSGIYYVAVLPLPLWYSILNLFIYLPFVYLGYLVVRKKELMYSDE